MAIEWRRRGYIGYDTQVTRSLRVGPNFHERSRALNAQPIGAGSVPKNVSSEESLSAESAGSLLRITPTTLRRLSRRGYLHAVECDLEWRYPSWQFAGRPRFAVLPGLTVVVPAIPKRWSPATINSFMTARHRELVEDGNLFSPVDWLLRGSDPEQIVGVLRAAEVSNAQHPSRR